MTEREQLYAAILANPEEDTVRLAFADWLEEHGEEARAGYVRNSIACKWEHRSIAGNGLTAVVLAQLPPLKGDVPIAQFRLAEPIPAVAFVARRGFVDEIHLTVQRFIDLGRELFRAYPICRVHLVDVVRDDLIREGHATDDNLPEWLFRAIARVCVRYSVLDETDSGRLALVPSIRFRDSRNAEDAVSRGCVHVARNAEYYWPMGVPGVTGG